MKKLLLITLFTAFALTLSAQELRYVDATSLTLINKAQTTRQPYQRIDSLVYPALTSPAKRYFCHSAGIAVVFRTNSSTIAAQWSSGYHRLYNNMTGIAATGLDLYIRRDGVWIPAGFGCQAPTKADHKTVIVAHMNNTEKECLLYLPLMDEVVKLEIGIDADAHIEPAATPFRHRIVVLGSSITHGTAASRSGMTYLAQLERNMGLEFSNLGISGNCKLEAEQARIVAETAADAFVFDCFSNPSDKMIKERLTNFVAIIRAKHPTTPLIFLQTLVRGTGNFDLERRDFEQRKRDAAVQGMQQLIAAGDPNLYFLQAPVAPGVDGTVDGCHPTDLGFHRITEQLEPQLRAIFDRYNLR
ncbi:MAG: SGNH/GDSL hydrolase family protein [Alistipes sp.]